MLKLKVKNQGRVLFDDRKNGDSTVNRMDIVRVKNADSDVIFIEAALSDSEDLRGDIRDIEDEDIADLLAHLDANGDGKIQKPERLGASASVVGGLQLIDNHSSRSLVTKKFEASGVRFQWDSPKNFLGISQSGTLDFSDDIVSIGTNEDGDILTFVCPEVTIKRSLPFDSSISTTGEVEIGQVAGKIDMVTGVGTIYLDNVRWEFSGNYNRGALFGNKSYGISSNNAAYVPVESRDGRGALIVLKSIKPGAYAGQNPDKIFSSYLVTAAQGETPKQPLAQTLVINAINQFIYPGLLDQGTSLQWNIDLKRPVSVNGL
ncbi:hypothetical protein CB0101_11960 [Synechococcus sp. CB0101]|uniref:hypothetical protein n=1 Tax=Synechococcus sp. CB0101 TaxID=232348 RepID=UPI0010A9BD76|nr:hypothetical protein [Synechococcus sp. CB0101]QCH15537.1 hypothetical protein CB0101_11960 [Synechococcus sp. CB0101]